MVTPPPPAGDPWADPVVAAAVAAAVDPVWPEMWRDQPALVFPARPDRPADAADWLPVRAALAADITPGWLVTLDDTRLQVTGREGRCWYVGFLCTARAWRRAVRARGRLLLVTGPFTHPLELPAAAGAGRLLCATADVRISGGF